MGGAHRPGPPRRRDPLRRRRARPRARRVARPRALGRRRADPRRDRRDRRAAPARAQRRGRRSRATTRSCRATTGTRRRARDKLAALGVDEAICFPNYGLVWERTLSSDLPALTANMAAWNRWCETVVQDGRGRLHPVAHLTLRDPVWLEAQLARLAAAGVRAAMIAPALVDGKPLSHPGARSRLGGVRAPRHLARLPRRRPAEGLRRSLVHRPRRSRRLRGRQRAPLRPRRARLHGPDPERRARAPPRSAARHRRALGRVGAALLDDARRRQPVRAPDSTAATRSSRCGRARTSSARCACRRSPTSCPRTSSASSAAPTC